MNFWYFSNPDDGGSSGGDSDGGGSLSNNPLGWFGQELGRKSTRPISGFTDYIGSLYYGSLFNTIEGGGTGQGPALGLDNTETNVRMTALGFNYDGSPRVQFSFGPKDVSNTNSKGIVSGINYGGVSMFGTMFDKDDEKTYMGCVTQNTDGTLGSNTAFGIEVDPDRLDNLHMLGGSPNTNSWYSFVGMETADDKSMVGWLCYNTKDSVASLSANTTSLVRWGDDTTGNPDNLRVMGGYNGSGTCIYRRGVADDNTTEPWFYLQYSAFYIYDKSGTTTPHMNYPGGSDTDSNWNNHYQLFSGSTVGKDDVICFDGGSNNPACIAWKDPDNSGKISIGIIGKPNSGNKKTIFWKQRQLGGVDETKIGNFYFTRDYRIWYVDKSTTPHSAVNLFLNPSLDSVDAAFRWKHKSINATLPGNTAIRAVWLNDTNLLNIAGNKYPGTQGDWTVTTLTAGDFSLTAPSTTRPPTIPSSSPTPAFVSQTTSLNADIGEFGNDPEWNWKSNTMTFPSSGELGKSLYFYQYDQGDWSPPGTLVNRKVVNAYYAYCPIDKDTIICGDQINPENYNSTGTGDNNRFGTILLKCDMSDTTNGPKVTDAVMVLTSNTDESSIYNRSFYGDPYGWSTGTDSHYFAFQTWKGTFTSSSNPMPLFGIMVMKFKDDMTCAWQKYYNGFSLLGRSGDSQPMINPFTTAKDSNILVTGEAGPKGVNTRNYCWWIMICLDKDGTQKWIRAYAKGSSWGGNSGSNNNWSAGGGQPCFDSDENLYIPWTISNPYSGERQNECGIMKVNKDGTQQWSMRYFNISQSPQNAPNGFTTEIGYWGCSCVLWNSKLWTTAYVGGPLAGKIQLLEIDPSDGSIDKIRDINIDPSCSVANGQNYPNGYSNYLFVDRNGKLILNQNVTNEGGYFVRFDTDMTVKNVWSIAGGSGIASGGSINKNMRDFDGFTFPYKGASKMTLTPEGRTGFVKQITPEGNTGLNQDLYETLPTSVVSVTDYSGGKYSATSSHSCTFFTPSSSDYGPLDYSLTVTAIDVPDAGWPCKAALTY